MGQTVNTHRRRHADGRNWDGELFSLVVIILRENKHISLEPGLVAEQQPDEGG